MNSDLRKTPQSRASENDNSFSRNVNYTDGIYPEELLGQSGGLDLKEFINVLSRRKKFIINTAIITTLLALLATLLMSPTYRSYSTLKVERYAANSNINILNAEASRSDRDFFETQIQLIQSRTLARRVIDQLNLTEKDTAKSLTTKIKSFFGSEHSSTTKNPDQVEIQFLENLTVKPVNNSQLLTISYDASNPKLSADINNAIAENFVQQNLERRFDSASSYKRYVTENIETTRESLEQAEARLNKYAQENGIVQDGDGKSTSSWALIKQAEELVKAENDRIEAEATYKLALKSPKNNSVSIDTINDPYIISLKKAAARLETQYQKFKNKRTRTPRLLRKQIDNLREQIANEGSSINSALYAGFLAAKQKESMLREQYQKLKTSTLNLQGKNTKYNRLKREVEIKQLSYDKQLEQLMAVDTAGKIGTNNISIIDKAGIPTRKYKPSLKTNLAFGLLLGLLLGMGIAFLREFVDDSIKDSDSLEKISGLPVLSQLPEIKNIASNKLALQNALEPRSMISESIKSLRTSLRFSTRNGAPKSIFITSSAASEGKSTIALNLATAYAQTSDKVLLIDADLRNPTIHKLLELDNKEGLTNYLASTNPTENNYNRTSMIKHLEVITSGPIPPDPVELLSENKMQELLETVSKQYDYIVIDGPPTLGLADALILSNLADACIVTVEAGKTRKASLLDTLKRLKRANANIVGTVFTKVSKAINPDYDQSYYSYSSELNREKAKS